MARLSLGIDCGSTTTKGALFDGETVVKTILLPTAARPRERMGQIYDAMYSSEVEYVVTTGYGRELLQLVLEHWSKHYGEKELLVECDSHSSRAVSLFKRHGFLVATQFDYYKLSLR